MAYQATYGNPSAQQAAANRFLRLADQDNQIDLVGYYAFVGNLNGFDSALLSPPTPTSSLNTPPNSNPTPNL